MRQTLCASSCMSASMAPSQAERLSTRTEKCGWEKSLVQLEGLCEQVASTGWMLLGEWVAVRRFDHLWHAGLGKLSRYVGGILLVFVAEDFAPCLQEEDTVLSTDGALEVQSGYVLQWEVFCRPVSWELYQIVFFFTIC